MAKAYNNYKLLYFSLFFAVIGLLGKVLYRPFIIANNIKDLGINSFVPNLTYTSGICLFISFISKKNKIKNMIFGLIGVLAYETEQIWTSRTFDYLDILATFFGFGLAILIYKLIVGNLKFETDQPANS